MNSFLWGSIMWVLMFVFILVVLASLVALIIAAIRALNAYAHGQRLRTAMLLAEHKEG
ncbi:hypothetical protein [Diaminobutyricimonas sp. LJ205]|uniref:hypothetical protein n=1 Tax=Diaminobutyricimonas sp. LJ205 TaxID=2683590 RepID=UPI0012F4806F|nr:hypothetical protein [Diaminobutyricimonas sp. LJ205]